MGAIKEHQACTPEVLGSIEIGEASVKVRARGKFRDTDAKDFVPTQESALLHIDTPNYDGPLDLLLFLIRKHSMDIFDIPIVLITKKYLDALDEMRALNLDLAGEFLLMAATLAQIKSKMLLPKEEQKPEGEEDDDGVDPRQQLIEKLLLYKSFKDAGEQLLMRPTVGGSMFLRHFSDDGPDDFVDDGQDLSPHEIAPVEIFELLEKLSHMLKKAERPDMHTITRDRISVSARISELMDFCQVKSEFSFYDALRFFTIYEKVDIIVTFLALLEMSRLKLLTIQISNQESLTFRIIKENFYTQQNLLMQDFGEDDNAVEPWK